MQTKQDDSLCPVCGRYKTLSESVGFCIECCVKRSVCPNCGKEEIRVALAGLCNYCSRNKWFSENADAVEHYMRAGLTYGMAVIKVMFDNRPICFCCGDKVKGSRWKREDNFCNKEECKRQARYYKYLRLDKNKTREEALEVISERITNSRSKQVA